MWTAENRCAYERKAQRYPSDLTDEEWALVEPHLPPPRQRSRHKSPERRDVLDAILYVLTTGCQWRALPKDFPPRSTVHDYFVDWHGDGTLTRVHNALYCEARELVGKAPTPTLSIVDSQSVKGAEKGGRRRRLPGRGHGDRGSGACRHTTRDRQTLGCGQRLRGAPQALDRGAHVRLARPMSPSRQGLREPCQVPRRIRHSRHDPAHAPPNSKATEWIMKIADRLLAQSGLVECYWPATHCFTFSEIKSLL